MITTKIQKTMTRITTHNYGQMQNNNNNNNCNNDDDETTNIITAFCLPQVLKLMWKAEFHVPT